MNAPPHDVNITLRESADRDGGRLVDYRRNTRCTPNMSINDVKHSPRAKQNTVQRKQHILKLREKGILRQHSSEQVLPSVKTEKEEEVYFCLRRRLIKRPESTEAEERNSITDDRNNFELPDPQQAGVDAAPETTQPKMLKRRSLRSLSLGQRTTSVDRSISGESSWSSNDSIVEKPSSIQRRKAPGRTVSEPIQVKRKEINVNISPRSSYSPRKILDCSTLEYSTGLEGIELLRQTSRNTSVCGSHSRSGWDCQATPDHSDISKEGKPVGAGVLSMPNDLLEASERVFKTLPSSKRDAPTTPNNMVTKHSRVRKKIKSKSRTGNSDGSAESVHTAEDSCQSSHCTTLSASSRDLSVVSRQDALDADAEARRKCYTWYARLGQPNREQMKRRVARMSSRCGITPSDVDKLAWICNGARISIGAMNDSLVNTTPREQQEMEVHRTTKENDNYTRNDEMARRAPTRNKSRRVPTRSLSEGLQIISKKEKEQQAGEFSCESAPASKRKDSVGLARARPNAPTRAVSDSLHHVGALRAKKHAKEKIVREVLEGLSLQVMLNELKSANVSPRRSPSRSHTGPASSEKEVSGHLHVDLSRSKSSLATGTASVNSQRTPVSTLKKIQPLVLEKPKQEVLAKRKKKLSGVQPDEEMALKRRPQTPSQKQFEITVVDTRPVQALSTTMPPIGKVTRGVSRREIQQSGLDGDFEGDGPSIQCAQLVVGDNEKSLDPFVASFMGLDHSDNMLFDEQWKKGRRPEFIQALSFLSSKRTTAESSSVDTSSATNSMAIRKGDGPSIQCAQLVVGDNKTSLDPFVASFMGLDHSDNVGFHEQRKKGRRPEFIQGGPVHIVNQRIFL